MIRRILYIWLTATLLVLFSCDLNDKTMVNDTLRDVAAVQLLEGNIGQVVFNQSSLSGRTTASIMQYLKEAGATIQFLNNYNFEANTFNDLWNQGFYNGSLVNLHEMKNLAKAETNSSLEAVANILLAHEYGSLSNMFGDIPMSEALLKDENLSPKYDTQEEIYENIISLLDDAISLIENNLDSPSLSGFDTIYNGNIQGWKQLAYGLKARFLLNLSKRNPTLLPDILDIVTTKSFASSSDQANFKYNLGFQNPLFKFGIERPGTLYIGDFFKEQLLVDPRKPSFMEEENGNAHFIGDPNLTWVQEVSTIPLFSYTELKFIEAEVLFLMESNVDNISEALADAMRSNFEITSGMTQVAIDYISARSDLSIISNNKRHERIMIEAYKAYYGYGFLQAWNNYRRTGYPILISTAFSATESNPSNIVPRRFPYPMSEIEFNLINLNDAIARQNGVLLDDDIWLFQ